MSSSCRHLLLVLLSRLAFLSLLRGTEGLSSSATPSSTQATVPPSDNDANFDWPKITGAVLKGERRAVERATALREVCSGCHRPRNLCLCAHLPKTKLVTSSTSILILQHPNERRKKNLSTTPLLQMALQRCTVKVGYDFDGRILEEFDGLTPLLLYPSDDAMALDDEAFCGDDADGMKMTATSHPLQDPFESKKKKHLLILMDGTWGEAKRMLRESPKLVERCQAVKFTCTDATSMYDVLRKEPQAHCLSTLEACSKALGYLEHSNNEEIQETLHALLKAHVDAHLRNKQRMTEQLRPRYVNRGGGHHVQKTRQELIDERMATMELEKLSRT